MNRPKKENFMDKDYLLHNNQYIVALEMYIDFMEDKCNILMKSNEVLAGIVVGALEKNAQN